MCNWEEAEKQLLSGGFPISLWSGAAPRGKDSQTVLMGTVLTGFQQDATGEQKEGPEWLRFCFLSSERLCWNVIHAQ